MFKFDIKRDVTKSEFGVGDRYYFGDLYDLCRILKCHRLSALASNFHPATYVLSILDSDDEYSTPAVVIHLENVDPNLIRKYYVELSRGQKRIRNEIGPSDWFDARKIWQDDLKDFDIDSYRLHLAKHANKGRRDPKKCILCKDKSKMQHDAAAWMMILVEKIFQAHENDTDFVKADSLKFSSLCYFINDLSWLYSVVKTSKINISMVNGLVYQLELNGKIMGYAINFTEFLRGREIGLTMLKEAGICFALIIKEYTSGHLEKISVKDGFASVLPLSEFLYEATYRSFYKSGKYQENEFFGSNIGNAFDFDRLPENIFVKILSCLLWRERARCRRVSNRWSTISDLALSIDTKIIDFEDAKYKNIKSEHFQRLLGVVTKGLESIIFTGTIPVRNDTLNSPTAFPLLQRIDFCAPIDFPILQSILNKCPKLKSLKVVDLKMPPNVDLSKTCGIEKLESSDNIRNLLDDHGNIFSDLHLMRLADYFPKLTWLDFQARGYVTNSCLSSFVERYGNKMAHLEIDITNPFMEVPHHLSNIGIFNGIGYCTNLTYLSLIASDRLSDGFMTALSDGCMNLETFIMHSSRKFTKEGLAKLARLPILKRLNISYINGVNGFSDAVMTIAIEGHLEELLVEDSDLSVDCQKACVRYCPQLKFMDVRDSDLNITVDDATEIVNLYKRWNRTPRLIWRTNMSQIWHGEQIQQIQNELNQQNQRRFIIDCRSDQAGFLDENKDEYEGLEDFYEDDDAHTVYSYNSNLYTDEGSDEESEDEDEHTDLIMDEHSDLIMDEYDQDEMAINEIVQDQNSDESQDAVEIEQDPNMDENDSANLDQPVDDFMDDDDDNWEDVND